METLWDGRETSVLYIPVPALPHVVLSPQELRGTWVRVHALIPSGFAGSVSPCEELPSQQPAHLQREIRRRTILISVFLPDFGSLPVLAAVPAPWEISSGGSPLACWGPHTVPRCF